MIDKHDDIEKALADLDKKSEKLKEKKSKFEGEIKKLSSSPFIEDKEKKIKLATQTANKQLWEDLKDRSIFWFCVAVLTMMAVFSMSRTQRTTLIEHLIMATLMGGMLASHTRNYRLFLPAAISSFIYIHYF